MQQYDKTEWVPEVTLVSAQRLNKMERQLETLTNESIKSNSQLNNVIAKNNEFDKVLNNAKYDYFGDEHISIVERLASDFDNVHQRINDSSYLLHEGSNIIANNSYYGYTKEMSIKGRTLRNLFGADSPNIQDSANRLQCSNLKNSDMYVPGTYTLVNLSDKVIIPNEYRGRTWIRRLPCQPKTKRLVTLESGASIREVVAMYDDGWTSNDLQHFLNSLLILEGDYTNIDFDIPYFEGIKSVGESDVTEEGKYPVNIKSSNKNLINLESISTQKTLLKKVKKGESYTFSYSYIGGATVDTRLQLVTTPIVQESNGEIAGSIDYKSCHSSIGRNSISLTSTIDGYLYLRIVMFNELRSLISSFQLEEGTSATDYEPYQESMQEILLDEPLRSLPNGVCDEIKDGVLIRRCGEITLNNKTKYLWGKDTTSLYIYMKDFMNVIKANSTLISSKLPWFKFSGMPVNRGTNYLWVSNAKVLCFVFSSDAFTTLDAGIAEAKRLIGDDGLKIIYELATPVEIPLTNYNINLKTFDGTTYITSTHSLPAIISCKVPTNVQETISNLIEENETLNTQVSTLNLENEEIKETNANQDELINTTMMAADEMYMMLEPLLADMLVDGETVSPLVNMYIAMINRGLKTIEQVPEKWREQVKKELGQLQE